MQPANWGMVALAIETKLRRSEQFRLRREQIDMENRVLTSPCQKVERHATSPSHTLRHTAASQRALAGVDRYRIKEILGHHDMATTQRDAHLTPGFLRNVANRGSLYPYCVETPTVMGTGSKIGSADERDRKRFAETQ